MLCNEKVYGGFESLEIVLTSTETCVAAGSQTGPSILKNVSRQRSPPVLVSMPITSSITIRLHDPEQRGARSVRTEPSRATGSSRRSRPKAGAGDAGTRGRGDADAS